MAKLLFVCLRSLPAQRLPQPHRRGHRRLGRVLLLIDAAGKRSE